jgi:hypothetical protein
MNSLSSSSILYNIKGENNVNHVSISGKNGERYLFNAGKALQARIEPIILHRVRDQIEIIQK